MSQRRRHLRNRLMLAFAGFTLFVAALFGLYVAAFAYSVEDFFLNRMVEREASLLRQQHSATGEWTQSRDPHMRTAVGYAGLPEELREIIREEPQRREFSGADGRHYHLLKLSEPASVEPVWLIAEVSDELVIRPRRAGLLSLLGWSALIVIAVALLLGYWLAHRTAAPLSRLAALMDQSTPDRLPDGFGNDFGSDETGRLAAALEQLIRRVRAFIEREREFTRDASHELRTPLAVIRGACEQLLRNGGIPTAQREQLAHIQQSATQLEQTVTTLLALARERPRDTSDAAVALLPIIERVILDQSPLLDAKAIDVVVDVARTTTARIPEPVVHILLSNLIGNAFAHTSGGEVRIEVKNHRLTISNPGPALRDSDFDVHVKSDSSAGFGFGLAIVRRLCDRHGIDLQTETATTSQRNVVSIAIGSVVDE